MRRGESVRARRCILMASRNMGRARFAMEQLEERLALSASVLTFHNDIASTGVNANETQLAPTNVKVGSFGKLYTTPLDGQAYAQPLIDPAISIASGVNTTAGSAGTHDVVFVATEHDSLYAIDSTVNGGSVLWKRSFTSLAAGYVGTTAGSNINNTLGATIVEAVPNGDINSSDITTEIGITGTPVIDSSTGIIYIVVKTRETIGGIKHYVQRIHAISITDGTDKAQPYLLGDTTGTNSNNTQIYVYGTGDGNVTDPYNGTGKPVVQFNALRENDRGALSLVGSTLYVHFASHGDNGPYHGWVTKWNVSTITTSGFQLTGVLNTSPNNGLSGIWGGGGRLSFEADGSAFYFETGNGSGGNPVLNASSLPSNANYNEAVVKVTADPTTTKTNQNPNGWGLKVTDFFTPYNVTALDNADQDFGSGSPLILPDSAGIAGHPHLLLASGKQGKIYVIDRDNMGKFDPNNDHVLNAVPDGAGHNTPPVQLGGSLSTPSYFNGKIYWVSGYSSTANTYTINTNGTLNKTSNSAVGSFGYLPGSPSISANGTTSGIVWVADRNANQLHAYNASSFATELWNTSQKAGGADSLGAVVKFAVPTVANGEVYVGTSNSLVVYGLTPPANAVPNAPVLSGTALSGSSVSLSWTDSSLIPNTASSYSIEQLIGGTYQQVTTAAAGSTTVAIGGLSPLTSYSFRIRGINGVGNSQYSNIVTLTTTNQIATIDYSGGFAGSTSKLTYNGSAALVGTKAELTNGGTGEAGSVFANAPVDITKFSTMFNFQLTNPNADGFTFTIQGNGPTSLGATGGGLGYGMPKSIAIKFDLYSNSGEGINTTGLYLNGVSPTTPAIDLTPSGIDLHSGDIFTTTIGYNGTTLTLTIQDSKTGKSFSQAFTVDIPANTGASAYVGFTGGTGGLTATQDILSWTFSPNAAQAPAAPTGLGAVAATATSVNLSWTNNATNQTAFVLDRATDSGFSQNLITQTLPATPSAFTDTYTGLAPGGTFYYRVRASNTGGSSANSAPAVVSIPLAPAKPDSATVAGVSINEIDLTWNDNAGRTADGYHILRAVNHGAFSLYDTLPAINSPGTSPTLYAWFDLGVLPGTFYDYHIQAYNSSGNNDFTGTGTTTLTNAPTSLTAIGSNNAASGSVALSWAAPTGAVSYNIYRGTAAGGETLLAGGVLTTTYTDTTAANGTTYFYKVTALNGNIAPLSSESDFSREVLAKPTPPPSVITRAVFYNNSSYDENDPTAVVSTDANAIDPTKQALRLPGDQASFVNYTSFLNGLNGIIVDLAGANSGALSAADFSFAVGKTSDLTTWTVPTAPAITVFPGMGAAGSDRIEIVFADQAIRNQWLQVTVAAKATTTRLSAPDVFYFGNLVGDIGNAPAGADAVVTISDIAATKSHNGETSDINSPFDFNRDGHISISDIALAKSMNGQSLQMITVPAVPMAVSSIAMATALITVPAAPAAPAVSPSVTMATAATVAPSASSARITQPRSSSNKPIHVAIPPMPSTQMIPPTFVSSFSTPLSRSLKKDVLGTV
jgi:hypothetical protein